MKLTITDKVFVPVSVNDELPISINKTVFVETDNDGMGIGFYSPKMENIVVLGTIEREVTNWLKEETNKYVLSKEEIEKVIIKAVELAREGIVVHRIPEWETDKEFDYTDLQIINSIL